MEKRTHASGESCRIGAPIRLAVVTSSYLPALGGMQILIAATLRAIDERFSQLSNDFGLEKVLFIVPEPYRSKELDSFSTIEVAYLSETNSALRHLRARRQLREILRLHEVNIVHGHDVVSAGIRIPGSKTRWAKVLTSHGSDIAIVPEHKFGARLTFRGKAAVALGLRGTDLLVTVSQTMANFASSVFPPGQTVVIPNFTPESVPSERFHGDELEELGIGPDTLVILTLGGPRKLKGHENLVRAFSLFLEKHPNAKLLIGAEAHLFGDIRALIDFLGISEACVFLGEVRGSWKNALFERADIYANTSFFEAFGLTSLEAVVSNAAFLGPENSGPSEIFEHQENAVLVDPSSVASIETGLLYLQPESTRSRLTRAAQLLMSQFTSEAFLESTFSAYRKVLGSKFGPHVLRNKAKDPIFRNAVD